MQTLYCVKCGYCCTVSICFFGEWSKEKNQCTFLTDDNLCSKYNEIIEKTKNHEHKFFGVGCSCTLFNKRREAKIEELRRNNER